MTGKLLLYGANGYTARLILPKLVARKVPLVLGGRDAKKIGALCEEFQCEGRCFSIDEAVLIDANLNGVSLVFNAAGPFAETAPALIDACLRAGCDYVDLSGEIEAVSHAERCAGLARQLGVMLLPAIGFDVVASDCLAAHLARRLPGAERLILSIAASNLVSYGSAVTLAEHLGQAPLVRREGKLEPVLFRMPTRFSDFGQGPRPSIMVSWSDLVTAYRSTRIPNIEVYFEATFFRWMTVATNQYWGRRLDSSVGRAWLRSFAALIPGGPSEALRAQEHAVIVGEVFRGGEQAQARVTTKEAYTFTAEAAAEVVERVLAGTRLAGFQTPALLFGESFVTTFDGVRFEELS